MLLSSLPAFILNEASGSLLAFRAAGPKFILPEWSWPARYLDSSNHRFLI
jgi:hypothetical protein